MGRLSRRGFLAGSAAAGATIAAGCAIHPRGSLEFLTVEQAQTLAALCDQVIPADDFPSASQAGVVTYIDRQLMRHYRRHRAAYEAGMKQADELSRARCGAPLAQAPAAIQQAVAAALERDQRKFFDLVRQHTMEGFYGSPRHGGNRDAVSWRMLGLAEPPVRGRAQYDFTKGDAG